MRRPLANAVGNGAFVQACPAWLRDAMRCDRAVEMGLLECAYA